MNIIIFYAMLIWFLISEMKYFWCVWKIGYLRFIFTFYLEVWVVFAVSQSAIHYCHFLKIYANLYFVASVYFANLYFVASVYLY